VSSFTSGPWHVEEHREPDGGYVISDDKSGMCLCSRAPWPTRKDESRANAHLIAAAPELLLIAKRCLEIVAEGAEPPDWDWIRDIIAKAEGRTDA
jgi:hypothetical protein